MKAIVVSLSFEGHFSSSEPLLRTSSLHSQAACPQEALVALRGGAKMFQAERILEEGESLEISTYSKQLSVVGRCRGSKGKFMDGTTEGNQGGKCDSSCRGRIVRPEGRE